MTIILFINLWQLFVDKRKMLSSALLLLRPNIFRMCKARAFSSFDPYKLLGVEKSASKDEIKKAYRWSHAAPSHC